MRRLLPWLVGGALALTAGIVTAVTPGDEVYRAPFLVHGTGEPQTARSSTLVVTALEATFAERVSVDAAEWHADGNWLVVTVAASAPRTEVDARIQLATLRIGDRVFQSSERPGNSITDADLRIGIDTVGTLAFELPPDAREGMGELRLTTSYATPVLGDVNVLQVPLDGLPTAENIDLEDPTLGVS